MSEEDRIALRPREAGRLLGIRAESVRELCRRGELPHRRLNRTYLISRDALQEWLRNGDQS